jgi:hypothetical protein
MSSSVAIEDWRAARAGRHRDGRRRGGRHWISVAFGYARAAAPFWLGLRTTFVQPSSRLSKCW